ncbi:KOW domain-containing RNA-binding protein [Eubacteriales bacterium OttesenSCG-928-N13]|nr:KOW domain-containing RNA-binding protein [Eubacteriales bacterium OttesenSCG-928-N13]
MNKIPLEAGRVVRSKSGRDQGRLHVIISEIDSDFVLVANGTLRKLDRPKKKRRKHLSATEHRMDTDAWPPENHQIAKLLKALDPKEEG